MKKNFLGTLVFVTLFGLQYGILEYYAIQEKAGYPFPPGAYLEKFSFYHIWIMAPIFLLISFFPLLFILSWPQKNSKSFFAIFLWGVGNFFWSVMIEDGAWFLARMIYPLKGDPLGGLWIQKGEWTARWGALDLSFGVIPYWYFAVLMVVLLLYGASWAILNTIKAETKQIPFRRF